MRINFIVPLAVSCLTMLALGASAEPTGGSRSNWQSELHKANGQIAIYYSPFGAQPKMMADAEAHFATALANAESYGPTHPGIAIVQLYWAGALLEPIGGTHAAAAVSAWRKCHGNRQYAKQLSAAKAHYLAVLKAHHPRDVAKFQAATF